MPADSPENKCPDECPECGSEKRWPPPVWTDGESGVTEECWHPWHEKPRCPDCGGSGANEFGDAFNNPCQTCGGSGRINTSGDFIGDKPGQGEHSCHENCPCSPSPDRETGGQPVTEVELDLAVQIGIDAIGSLADPEDRDLLRLGIKAGMEGLRSAPSAAPTNSGVNQTEGEGEGLAARIEELAEKYEEVAALALGFASEKVSCSSVASDLRSLLVPKEEA